MEQPKAGKQPQHNIFSRIVNHDVFIKSIIVLIVLNSVLIGLETFPKLYNTYGEWFHFIDICLLWLFTIEIALRLLAVRPTLAFFSNGWNIFDFIIVASGHLLAGAQFVTILRILRILRMLRTFSVIPSLRRMVNALIMTIPALANIIFLMLLVMYIFGVAGTILFSEASPEFFGSLPATLLTLFQVATLESWASGVMRPLLDDVPWAWMYFVAFITVGTFVVINLFLGVIVSNMDKVNQQDMDDDKKAANAKSGDEKSGHTKPEETNESFSHAPLGNEEMRTQIASMRNELAELKSIILEHQKKN